MIHRTITDKLLVMAQKFPVVTLTGPRQSGKSTLVKAAFPDYAYITLEDPDERAFAQDDPRAFLGRCGSHAILDEVQRVPDLFSYIQGIVDASGEAGQYILSGSQNFLLMQRISQSLAGRAAVLHLLPLSYGEASTVGVKSNWDWIFTGAYPRIYDFDIPPADYYPSYVQTYLERDVRDELGVGRIGDFRRFMGLCAARIGGLLNVDELARECGINAKTARSWLSALQQSFVIYLLAPYHANVGKRLTRSPKLYFYDTGLACSLLGMDGRDDAETGPYRGALFENAVLEEVLKEYFNEGREPRTFFWRDSNGLEADFLVQKGSVPSLLAEAKASTTYSPQFFKNLDKIGELLGVANKSRCVIYGGDEAMETCHGQLIGLRDAHELAV